MPRKIAFAIAASATMLLVIICAVSLVLGSVAKHLPEKQRAVILAEHHWLKTKTKDAIYWYYISNSTGRMVCVARRVNGDPLFSAADDRDEPFDNYETFEQAQHAVEQRCAALQ